METEIIIILSAVCLVVFLIICLGYHNRDEGIVVHSIITGPILDKELNTLELSKTTIPTIFDYVIITSAGELYNTKFYYKDYLAFSSQLDPRKIYFAKKERISIKDEFDKDSPTKDNWKEGTLIVIYINNIPYLRELKSKPISFPKYDSSIYIVDFVRFSCYIPGTKESETITINSNDNKSYKRIYRVCFELNDIKQIKCKDDEINNSNDDMYTGFSGLH